jgi:hyperosmotically inducible protein
VLKRLSTVCFAAAIAVACSQTDAGVTTAVKSKMAADDTVKAYQIDVTTKDHVVTLSGRVETTAAKEQAVQIARSTDGVRDVVDHLTVSATAPTTGFGDGREDFTIDDRAREEAREAGEAAEHGAERVEDAARRGADKTEDAARRGADKAEHAAENAGAMVKDAAITSAVKAKLLADDTVKGLNIDVDTSNGVVTLNGTAHSRTEASQAVRLARGTDGVKNVVDNMRISK